MQQKPRQIAARILFEWESGGIFVETILRQTFSHKSIKPIDRHLIQELVYGVIRNRDLLDAWIDSKASRPPGNTRARNLLRLGLYQLAFMSRIPSHAAVHETVATARELGLHSQAGFINAILRGFLRGIDQYLGELESWKSKFPYKAWSHPKWLFDKWTSQFSQEQACKLMEWNNGIPSIYARCHSKNGSPEALESMWNQEGVQWKTSTFPWIKNFQVYKITSFPCQPDQLDSFKQGRFYLQDPSTLMAVEQLNARPDSSVLDYCAAPGGKTCAVADMMRHTGTLVAIDPDPGRLNRLHENIKRLGVSNVQASESPFQTSKKPEPIYDKILIDAPCSNTGVMRRRLDVRWRISPEEISAITEKQYGILNQAVAFLKPGGQVVYSTCSLEPEENQGIIERFLAENGAFKLNDQHQLSPFSDKVDGAFVANLQYEA